MLSLEAPWPIDVAAECSGTSPLLARVLTVDNRGWVCLMALSKKTHLKA